MGPMYDVRMIEIDLNPDPVWSYIMEQQLAAARHRDLVALLPPTGPHYTDITEPTQPRQDEGW